MKPTFRDAMQFFLYETRPTWLNLDTGEVRFDELAKAVDEWLVAIPVEQRMEAMGMREATWRDAEDVDLPLWTDAPRNPDDI